MIRNALTKLASENNNAIKTLSENDRVEINRNTEYVRAKGVGIYDSELFRKDLISMYHERKLRDESTADMNTREFCDSVIENCPKRSYEAVFYTLYQFSITIFIWSVFDLLLSGSPYSLHTATIVLYLLTIVFHFCVYCIFPRITLSKLSSTCIPMAVLLAFACVVLYLQNGNSITAASTWIAIPSGIWFASHLIFFIIMKFVWDCYIDKLAKNE